MSKQWNRGSKIELSFSQMRAFTAVIERCPDTGLFVGYVPGSAGAHSQRETVGELRSNLAEVIGMMSENEEPS
jgi:predicted RNase H-like HicB family nuclease